MANGNLVDYVFVIELPEDKGDIAKLEAAAARPPVRLLSMLDVMMHRTCLDRALH
jgi:hypothetical protein